MLGIRVTCLQGNNRVPIWIPFPQNIEYIRGSAEGSTRGGAFLVFPNHEIWVEESPEQILALIQGQCV